MWMLAFLGTSFLLALTWALLGLHAQQKTLHTEAEIEAELRDLCREVNRELDRKRLDALQRGDWRRVR